MKLKQTFLTAIFATLLFSSVHEDALAYEFEPGDWFLRPIVGARINVIRFDTATRETPGAGMVIGAQGDYMVDISWGVSGELRSVFSPGFVSLGLSGGIKYRFLQTEAPFIPYVATYLTTGFLFPTQTGSFHFNLGLRPCGGLDYFIMRDLAVGLEVGFEPSVMFMSSETKFELGIDTLLGVTWRL